MEGECGTPHEHELLEERAAAEKHHTPANVHVAGPASAGPPAPAFGGSSGDGGGLLATDAASETHRDAAILLSHPAGPTPAGELQHGRADRARSNQGQMQLRPEKALSQHCIAV
jgi:hypothetical protein